MPNVGPLEMIASNYSQELAHTDSIWKSRPSEDDTFDMQQD